MGDLKMKKLIVISAAFALTIPALASEMTIQGRSAERLYSLLNIKETAVDAEGYHLVKSAPEVSCYANMLDSDDESTYYCFGTAKGIYENLKLDEVAEDAESFHTVKSASGITCR